MMDARLVGVLQSSGHEAWTADQIGLANASDDEIAIAAHERGAVCITHDAEFTNKVKRRGFNSHIRLRCLEPDALDLLNNNLDRIVHALGWGTVVIVVGKASFNVSFAKWDT